MKTAFVRFVPSEYALMSTIRSRNKATEEKMKIQEENQRTPNSYNSMNFFRYLLARSFKSQCCSCQREEPRQSITFLYVVCDFLCVPFSFARSYDCRQRGAWFFHSFNTQCREWFSFQRQRPTCAYCFTTFHFVSTLNSFSFICKLWAGKEGDKERRILFLLFFSFCSFRSVDCCCYFSIRVFVYFYLFLLRRSLLFISGCYSILTNLKSYSTGCYLFYSSARVPSWCVRTIISNKNQCKRQWTEFYNERNNKRIETKKQIIYKIHTIFMVHFFAVIINFDARHSLFCKLHAS